MSKTSPGNFFEDFRVGQVIRHATPRTVTTGDVALYNGLFGPRFAVQSSDEFAKAIGYPRSPIDDLLVFHIVFGKTVPDVSLNAVANLGYAGLLLSQSGLSRRYLVGAVRSHRAEGKFQPQDRHRLCAHHRLQTGRHRGARICPLGDGAKARRSSAGARRPRAAPGDRARRQASERSLSADRRRRLRLRHLRQQISLWRLSGRRAHRSCRRHHRRRSRAHDRDAALSEHRAHPLRSVRRQGKAASAGG